MFLRAILTLICLAATAWYLDGVQKSDRFQKVDDWFLDFLVANTRPRFEKAETAGGVALVELREQDRAEYASWPPPPLDWQTLLKELSVYEPDVLLITTPLNWGQPAPDFTPAVAEALLKFPGVILGIEAPLEDGEKKGPAFLGEVGSLLPRFREVSGDAELTRQLAGPLTVPDPLVRVSNEVGLMCVRKADEEWKLPYAVFNGETLLPTVLAQTLALASRSPYEGGHRLRLGAGAGAYLLGGVYVPLENSGEFSVPDLDTVPTVNALQFMSGSLADALSDEDKASLKKTSVLVVGTTATNAQASFSRLYARALNHLLALPKIRVLTQMEQWVAWAIAAAAALWMVLKVRRTKAVKTGLALIFAAFIASYLLFQSNLLWCPPTLPVALIAVGMLLGKMIGRKAPLKAASPKPDETATT